MRLTKILRGKQERYKISPALCVSEPPKWPAAVRVEKWWGSVFQRETSDSASTAFSTGRQSAVAEKGLTRGSPAQDSHAYSLASTTLGQLPGLACLLEPPLGEKGTMEPSKVKAGTVSDPGRWSERLRAGPCQSCSTLWKAKIHLWKACQD